MRSKAGIFRNGSTRGFDPLQNLVCNALFKFSHGANDVVTIGAPYHRIVAHAFENLETVVPALGAVKFDTHLSPHRQLSLQGVFYRKPDHVCNGSKVDNSI
jgi:hypothetical protein